MSWSLGVKRFEMFIKWLKNPILRNKLRHENILGPDIFDLGFQLHLWAQKCLSKDSLPKYRVPTHFPGQTTSGHKVADISPNRARHSTSPLIWAHEIVDR